MIDSGCLDLVDIEYWIGDERVKELIDYARAKNVYSVYTYHNFKDTPSVEWICNYIAHGRELGADIQKCATMATSKKDLLRLLTATEMMTSGEDDGLVLTMAMGGDGMLSRLTGEIFASRPQAHPVRSIATARTPSCRPCTSASQRKLNNIVNNIGMKKRADVPLAFIL